MVRFKNRYLVLELLWKDGRLDETLSEKTDRVPPTWVSML
jgi:hypothetical protein